MTHLKLLICVYYRWKDLQGQLSGYKQKLAAALEIHSFNRDVDDINGRINEKSALLSSEDLGKDLPAVQALQRKQEAIERDMTALQNQLEVCVQSHCSFGVCDHALTHEV